MNILQRNKSKSGEEKSALDQPLAGARTALILLVVLNLLNYIDRQLLAAVVPNIKAEFFAPGVQHGWLVSHLLSWLGAALGTSNPENAVVGLLAMAFVVSYMCLAPLLAALPMRRWSLIGMSTALWTIATGFCGLANSFGALLFRRALVGVGEAGYGAAAPTMLSDYYPARMRASILSWFYATAPLGAALAFILVGFIEPHFGWRWVFGAMVIPGLLVSAVCFFAREPKVVQSDSAPEDKIPEKKVGQLQAYGQLVRNPSYVLCTLGMAAMMFAMGALSFWTPDYIHGARGVENLAQVNTIFGLILVVAGIGGTLAGGKIADCLRDRVRGSYFSVSAAAMLLSFVSWLAMLWAPFPFAWIFVFLTTFGLFFNTGPTIAILCNVTKPSIRLAANALNILVIHAFGDVISPLVVGAVTDATGSMTTALLFASVAVLVSCILWFAGAPFLARDTALVTAESNSG